MKSERVVIKRALLGVSDKAGLAAFAKALERHGVEIVSTGGTAAALEKAGVKVRTVENFTGLPEMLDGRVKTLHPKIHGGILARRADENHQREMQQHRIEPIDMVVVNFYPFEKTVARIPRRGSQTRSKISTSADPRWCVQRQKITTMSWSSSMRPTTTRLPRSSTRTMARYTADTRWRLARKAFARVTAYDAAISNYLGTHAGDGNESPRRDFQPFARARAGAALRRESASDRRALRPLPGNRASASRQGTVVQQRRRHQLGDEPDARVRRRAAALS